MGRSLPPNAPTHPSSTSGQASTSSARTDEVITQAWCGRPSGSEGLPKRRQAQFQLGSAAVDSACSSAPLAGHERDPHRAEVDRARLVDRAAEDVRSANDAEALEAARFDHRLQLCFQQSAGDSPGPERDVLLGAFGHRSLHRDVADLQTSAWLDHPAPIAQRGSLVLGVRFNTPLEMTTSAQASSKGRVSA